MSHDDRGAFDLEGWQLASLLFSGSAPGKLDGAVDTRWLVGVCGMSVRAFELRLIFASASPVCLKVSCSSSSSCSIFFGPCFPTR